MNLAAIMTRVAGGSKKPSSTPPDQTIKPAEPVSATKNKMKKQTTAKDEEKPDVQLGTGTLIDARWELERKLGEGAFGAVYQCVDKEKKIKDAMALKIESMTAEDQVLKIEVAVLRAMQCCKTTCRLIDAGCTDEFNFLIMTLLGPSLDRIKKNSIQEKFTQSTAFKVTYLCMEAIRDMHNCGWLHRDIKPSNFAIGHTPATKRIFYIFDFGLARNYWTRQNALREKRPIVGFRGTMRYCSIHAHLKEDLGRHDDLISLLYMHLEMILGILPWKKFDDEDDVFESKQELASSVYEGVNNSKKLIAYSKYLHSLRYEDKPRYSKLEEILLETIQAKKYESHVFDWEDEEVTVMQGIIPQLVAKRKRTLSSSLPAATPAQLD